MASYDELMEKAARYQSHADKARAEAFEVFVEDEQENEEASAPQDEESE